MWKWVVSMQKECTSRWPARTVHASPARKVRMSNSVSKRVRRAIPRFITWCQVPGSSIRSLRVISRILRSEDACAGQKLPKGPNLNTALGRGSSVGLPKRELQERQAASAHVGRRQDRRGETRDLRDCDPRVAPGVNGPVVSRLAP